MLEAGEAIVDIVPPTGIELAGFHKPPGKERVITGIRQIPYARALVLRAGRTTAAILSLDICAFGRDFARRIQKRVSKTAGIPANHVRVCATHTHSMPTLRYFRQWGAVSPAFSQRVEDGAVEAVMQAKKDLAQADCYVGRQRVGGGNFNRTSPTWKTDTEFSTESTDRERWIDTMLHVLYFLREKPRRSLLWYQFSAHPVCYTDQLAGPDWPGLVVQKTEERDGLKPSFLQGHCGDVNPGDGHPNLGDPEKVSEAVWTALHHAMNHSEYAPVHDIQVVTREFDVPLDLALLKDELARYQKDPAQCAKGEWVDAAFARDWFEGLSKWKLRQAGYRAPISALRLGSIGLLFHPGELYSYYGLAIRRESPFPDTVVVGYTDDMIGYLPDPTAYEKGEYAALVVPKILDLPPWKPEAARELTKEAVALLHRVAKAG